MTDNSMLYRMMGDKCEHCGKDIIGEAVGIWVADDNPSKERRALFCNDECLLNWWDTPEAVFPN